MPFQFKPVKMRFFKRLRNKHNKGLGFAILFVLYAARLHAFRAIGKRGQIPFHLDLDEAKDRIPIGSEQTADMNQPETMAHG